MSRISGMKTREPPLPEIKFPTTTLLVIESDVFKDLIERNKVKLPTVKVGSETYLVAAVLGVRHTSEVYQTFITTTKMNVDLKRAYPIAQFYWKTDTPADSCLKTFISSRIQYKITPPFEYSGGARNGLIKVHKIVCKGEADSDGNYSQVLENHYYLARPIYCASLDLDPEYTELFRVKSKGIIRTTRFIFVHDKCEKNSIKIEDEKLSGSVVSKSGQELVIVKEAIVRAIVLSEAKPEAWG